MARLKDICAMFPKLHANIAAPEHQSYYFALSESDFEGPIKVGATRRFLTIAPSSFSDSD